MFERLVIVLLLVIAGLLGWIGWQLGEANEYLGYVSDATQAMDIRGSKLN